MHQEECEAAIHIIPMDDSGDCALWEDNETKRLYNEMFGEDG